MAAKTGLSLYLGFTIQVSFRKGLNTASYDVWRYGRRYPHNLYIIWETSPYHLLWYVLLVSFLFLHVSFVRINISMEQDSASGPSCDDTVRNGVRKAHQHYKAV